MRRLPRILGLLTAGYGLWSLARLTAGLEQQGALTPTGAALGRVVGVRDTSSGAAMLLAPAGTPRRAAVAVRVLCDLSDAVALGTTVPSRSRAKVLAVTLGWAALCAASYPLAGERR